MGYTTYFEGALQFNKEVSAELKEYVNKFNETRRMRRDNNKIMQTFQNWKELCFNGNLGTDGEYFVGGIGMCGQGHDDSILDHNRPAITQPGLWCQWIINDNNELVWNDGEKFYEYIPWLQYMIQNFFEPLGYVLNGEISFQGEEYSDNGTILVYKNSVVVK